MLATQYGKSPRKANSSERPNSPSSGHPPNRSPEITAATRNRIAGPATATSHHPSPTRQRNTRPSNSRTPAEPPARAVMTKADSMGPRPPARWKRAANVRGSEGPRARNTAGAHTTQEKAKANTKKNIKGCLRAIELTLTREGAGSRAPRGCRVLVVSLDIPAGILARRPLCIDLVSPIYRSAWKGYSQSYSFARSRYEPLHWSR